MRKEQENLIKRINELCREKGLTYYALSYRSTVPLGTLVHIMDGSTKNPGIFTISKLCDGMGISLAEFFSTFEFSMVELAEEEKELS